MTHRPLGHSDLVVSSVGLGCNNVGRAGRATEGREGTDAVISSAIEAGVTLFDTADVYGSPPTRSETLIGEVLGTRRDDVVLATKFGHAQGNLGPEAEEWGPRGGGTYVRNACEGSLRRLRTDRIDLYQMHTPDPSTPIAETLQALDQLVSEGKVRHIGHSNFDADQVAEADRVSAENGWARFVSAQNEYSLLAREAEETVLPAVVEHRLGFLPYFPLANGLLTGKYARSGGPTGARVTARPDVLQSVDWGQLDAYRSICADLGHSMTQVTFAWLLTRPAMGSVIAGATTPEQVSENAGAAAVDLPSDAVQRIDDLFA
jgi:aryl-alcohol dehydrogenase-like predicted oxidoreductase